MITANDISIPAEFRAVEPDVSETYGRTVEAPEHAARAAADRLDLVGPLVEGLIALGVDEHIVTPQASGIVWRFGAGEPGQVQIDWVLEVSPRPTTPRSSPSPCTRPRPTRPAASGCSRPGP